MPDRKTLEALLVRVEGAGGEDRLEAFVRESNAIEGIHRDPTDAEIVAHRFLLSRKRMTAGALATVQAVVAPDKPIRDRPGLDVRVGGYVAPRGGPEIVAGLTDICRKANWDDADPYELHVAFEMLHPFMDGNGRTGRALWAWIMQEQGNDPFALPFLHRFYYQTLEHSRDF